MKFKHVRERELGYKRRIEELEDALRFCLLACESVRTKDDLLPTVAEIEQKIQQILSERIDIQ